MTKKNNSLFLWFILVLLVLAVTPLFFNLSFLPIRLFDESRLAVNALEMSRGHNFLVTHYKNEPDMWNLKPPLMIWCQVFWLKIIGEGELAIRLPSAIAGLLTILLLFIFFNKTTDKPLFGFLTALVLLGTSGYISEHGTRTGDYDALLVLFQMSYLMSWYVFLNDTANTKMFFLTCVLIVLAVFTKGIAGFMFLPSLFIYTLLIGKLKFVIFKKETWLGIAGVILAVAGYYFLREFYNPEYLNKVYENEIYYRYFDVNEGHEGKWSFYLDVITGTAYKIWFYFAITGMITTFFIKDVKIRKLILYFFINFIVFFIIISNSQTKIEWYALPLYPLLAIFSAAFFWFGFERLSTDNFSKFSRVKLIPIYLFLIVFGVNYFTVVKNVIVANEHEKENNIYRFSYVFQEAFRDNDNLNGFFYCYPPYNAHLHFYTEVLEKKNQFIQTVAMDSIKRGMKVLAATDDVKNFIGSTYLIEVEKNYPNGVVLYLIKEKL